MCVCRARYPDMTPDLKEFEAHLLQGSRELPELKLWQLQGEGKASSEEGKMMMNVFGKILVSKLLRG